MNISLGQEQQEFIQTQIQAGVYDNPDDLVNEAIALLAAKHRKLSELKQMIAIGTEQIQRGEVTDGETVFNRLQVKYGFSPESAS
ncbi:MAG: type II toxin-antitoxin system ParD family antitoxin [Nodosilinea sp.]